MNDVGGVPRQRSTQYGSSDPIGASQGLIDAHCHLEEKETFFRSAQLINDCGRAGMKALVTVCTRPADFKFTLELLDEHPGFVFATAGMHPMEAVSHSETDIDAYIEQIRSSLKDKHRNRQIRAIGEIGLDNVLVKERDKMKRSRDVFIQFIDLAKKLKLPIVIHCREAYPETMKLLSDHGAKRVVFHYFNSPQFVGEIMENGWHLSLPATLAFSKKKLSETLVKADPARVMIETDSPIELSGGRRLTPFDVRLLAEAIAKEKKEPVEKTVQDTSRCASDFFSLF